MLLIIFNFSKNRNKTSVKWKRILKHPLNSKQITNLQPRAQTRPRFAYTIKYINPHLIFWVQIRMLHDTSRTPPGSKPGKQTLPLNQPTTIQWWHWCYRWMICQTTGDKECTFFTIPLWLSNVSPRLNLPRSKSFIPFDWIPNLLLKLPFPITHTFTDKMIHYTSCYLGSPSSFCFHLSLLRICWCCFHLQSCPLRYFTEHRCFYTDAYKFHYFLLLNSIWFIFADVSYFCSHILPKLSRIWCSSILKNVSYILMKTISFITALLFSYSHKHRIKVNHIMLQFVSMSWISLLAVGLPLGIHNQAINPMIIDFIYIVQLWKVNKLIGVLYIYKHKDEPTGGRFLQHECLSFK